MKSVSNMLEVVKELPEVITHKQDEIITRHVKERFAKSATVTAANFDVKTDKEWSRSAAPYDSKSLVGSSRSG